MKWRKLEENLKDFPWTSKRTFKWISINPKFLSRIIQLDDCIAKWISSTAGMKSMNGCVFPPRLHPIEVQVQFDFPKLDFLLTSELLSMHRSHFRKVSFYCCLWLFKIYLLFGKVVVSCKEFWLRKSNRILYEVLVAVIARNVNQFLKQPAVPPSSTSVFTNEIRLIILYDELNLGNEELV